MPPSGFLIILNLVSSFVQGSRPSGFAQLSRQFVAWRHGYSGLALVGLDPGGSMTGLEWVRTLYRCALKAFLCL